MKLDFFYNLSLWDNTIYKWNNFRQTKQQILSFCWP